VKALIDGDIILYGCGFASQHTYYQVFCEHDALTQENALGRFQYKKDAAEWSKDMDDMLIIPKVEIDPPHIARSNTRNFIAKIIRETEADDYIIYFSDPKLERDEIATMQTYKGNRIGAPKPYYYHQIKDYVTNNYKWKVYKGLEADDAMAMNQKQDRSTIICTLDKDLDMVPGMRYRDGKIYDITPENGQLSFYTQLITGDSTDNIPGLFKLTGKKALAALKKPLEELTTPLEMYTYVKSVYMDAFGCDGELNDVDVVLLEIGQLLWMRRSLEKNWEIPR